MDQLKMKLYPNPSKEKITIEYNGNGIQKFLILTMQGKIIRSGIIDNKSQQIDISDLEPSLYFLQIDTEVQQFTKY